MSKAQATSATTTHKAPGGYTWKGIQMTNPRRAYPKGLLMESTSRYWSTSWTSDQGADTSKDLYPDKTPQELLREYAEEFAQNLLGSADFEVFMANLPPEALTELDEDELDEAYELVAHGEAVLADIAVGDQRPGRWTPQGS